MGSAVINWGDRSTGGSGPTPPPSDPNVTVITGALNEEIVTSGVEIVIGGFIFDPTIYAAGSTIRFRNLLTIVQTGFGLGFPNAVRLYDRGAPGTPEAGTLRATVFAGFTSNVPVVAQLALTPTGAPGVDLGEIFNSERMYELRAFATLDTLPGDALIVRWSGLEVS